MTELYRVVKLLYAERHSFTEDIRLTTMKSLIDFSPL